MTTNPGVLDHYRRFAEAVCQGYGRLDGCIVRLVSAHHLDQAHERHRVEEVQAEEALRARHRPAELGDRDRGGIGRDDGVVPRARRNLLLQDLELQRLVLARRFEDQVADAQPAVVRRAAQAGERDLTFARGELRLLDQPVEACRHGSVGTRDTLLIDVDHYDQKAGERAGLRDPRPWFQRR